MQVAQNLLTDSVQFVQFPGMVQTYNPVVGYMLTAVFQEALARTVALPAALLILAAGAAGQALACNMTILDVHGLPCLGTDCLHNVARDSICSDCGHPTLSDPEFQHMD